MRRAPATDAPRPGAGARALEHDGAVEAGGAEAGGAESGAASVLAIGIIGAMTALAVALLALLGVFVVSQRAANAADAAALAAADAMSGAVPGVPCRLAGAIAARNGARLDGCGGDGATASVTVVVDAVPGFAITASARAGPPEWPGAAPP
ncbi:secretion/DNA translocation related TadE-like protein [Agromyces cerinus]|uniref:Rv3654c family TadE-like protein n=1 Tax=Agromyces cerinus TaxID=33878 RepID=UPI00195B9709|nr:Rv3654c family TadE-like protein [Agromyces cerinus]MBM7829893.1 secretion/DNA translocation related TadE-like protein [Agromyces cerinus]